MKEFITSIKAKERGNPSIFRLLSFTMKTVPKVEDPQFKKFHYDPTQWMLLSIFIARLSGNPGQQVRFKMPAMADQALHIAATVFEADVHEKRNLVFSSNLETYKKGRGKFG